MGYIDITRGVAPDIEYYPGDPPVRLEAWNRVSMGDDFNVSELRCGTHTGTHVDAPAHCWEHAAGVDLLALESLCGPAVVLDLEPRRTGLLPLLIEPSALEGAPAGCQRLLLRTRGRTTPEVQGEAALSETAARWLVERDIRLIGIDELSIAPAADQLSVHRLLLGAGVVILEGLDLSQVQAGRYEVYCLPLKLLGADGAPARAILSPA